MIMNWSLSGGKICPVHINFTSPQHKTSRTAIILQFLVDFILILVFLNLNLNIGTLF